MIVKSGMKLAQQTDDQETARFVKMSSQSMMNM